MIEKPLYLDKIMPFVDTPFLKILTGVRRCGKSTILKMIIKKLREEKHVDDEQILSYRFDSMEYEDMTTKELYVELKSKIIQSKKAI
ncbi:AAA family ATPase [Catenibacterium sp.]|jgi:Predicted ATPase (AAA+ superfamily)|uniref:AAA family ATPase n=1 Tax=Catenibacterium sp. TaxID=2049022 RepID=UPI00257F94BA|nr:AAA family ATPase [Catenibacterium sp.]